MKKCSQCQALYSDDDMTICPKCGVDLEVVHVNKVLAENPTPVTSNPEHTKVIRQGALTYVITALVLSLIALTLTFVPNLLTTILFVLFIFFAWIPFTASIQAANNVGIHQHGANAGGMVRLLQLLVLLVQAVAIVLIIVN